MFTRFTPLYTALYMVKLSHVVRFPTNDRAVLVHWCLAVHVVEATRDSSNIASPVRLLLKL